MQGNISDKAEEAAGSPWAGRALCQSALLHQGAAFFTAAPTTGPEQQQGPKRGIKGLLQVLWGSKSSPGEDKKELERVLLTWGCCLCFDTHMGSSCENGELKLSFIPCGELKKPLSEEHGQARRPKAQTRGTKQAERIYKAAIDNIAPFQRALAAPQDTERERHHHQQNVCWKKNKKPPLGESAAAGGEANPAQHLEGRASAERHLDTYLE